MEPWVDQMQFYWSWFDMYAYRYPDEQRSSSTLDLVQDKNKVVSRRDTIEKTKFIATNFCLELCSTTQPISLELSFLEA
jgi:hypothetical protein